MRALPEIPSLRVLNGWVRRALVAGGRSDGFRLIYFAILGNHIHLIVEGDDRRSLSRGVQGLAIRIARAVNQAMSRKRGKVFSDRFHEHVLRSLRETKAAVHYVLNNYKKHCSEAADPWRRTSSIRTPRWSKWLGSRRIRFLLRSFGF
jgi:REP element-mobilizing transposase RayT